MRDLLLEIDDTAGRRVGLERALRDSVRAGRLIAGSAMPSTRSLAADLGYARSTVVEVYEQLTAEGYFVSRQGVGTLVADVKRPLAQPTAVGPFQRRYRADFRPGEPDTSLFPRDKWLRSVRTVLAETPDESLGYPDPRGPRELRLALADYLARSRAVEVTANAVCTFAGFAAAVGCLAETLRRRGIDRIAIEDPALFITRDILRLAGVEVVPIGLDEGGIEVDALDASGARGVIVTPGHQYPMGMTMNAERRAEIVEWAKREDAWIIEDDYDGEFRYDRRPLGALQGLAPDRVVYAGTSSKSLIPGLRLGWLVVPAGLQDDVLAVKHARWSSSILDQLTLADFMQRGELDRHVRHARSVYRARRAELVTALSRDVRGLSIAPHAAGLHVTCHLPVRTDEAQLVRDAAAADIGLLGLGVHRAVPGGPAGLVIGYTRPPAHAFDAALIELVGFLAERFGRAGAPKSG